MRHQFRDRRTLQGPFPRTDRSFMAGALGRGVREAARRGCDMAAVDLLDTPGDPDLCGALREAGLRVVTFDNTGPGRLSAHAVVNFLVRDPEPAALVARGVQLYEGP